MERRTSSEVPGRARPDSSPDRDHLGEHHRRRLEGFLFLLLVDARRPVLDDEHAQRVARAQDRDAEERLVDLFAGLRQVAERGVRLGVAEVQRPRLLGDRADEALADVQRRLVDGFAFQAFRGVQLQDAVGAQHVDRAHLGHHVGGDLGDGLVEPGLRADRLRHDLAQAAEQGARPGGWPPHIPLSSVTASDRPGDRLFLSGRRRFLGWTDCQNAAIAGAAPPNPPFRFCRARITNAKSVPQARCTRRRSAPIS